MAKAKDLYIAKSMKELNEKCLFDFDKDKSIKTHLTMVNKVYQAAEAAFSSKDEERAYVLYMRYVDAMMKIRKTKDYRSQVEYYNTLFVTSKLTTAVEKAEKLSNTLKKRYSKLVENKDENNSSENVAKKPDIKTDFKVKTKDKDNLEKNVEYSFPTTSINVQELHHLLYKSKKKVLLMDIRSLSDYQESHFVHPSCMNVPNNAITPGSVTSKIERGILLDDIKLWNSRDTVDIVILVDWHSTAKRLQDKSDPLRSLKDSIFKWEQQKELIREPVVLEGGYAEWLESFPQFTSNPHVNPPSNKPKTSNINSLLDFDYSELKKDLVPKEEMNRSDQKEKALHPITNGFSSSDAQKEKSINKVNDKNSFKPEKTISIPNPLADKGSTNINGVANIYPKFDKVLEANKTSKTTKLQDESRSSDKLIPAVDRSTKPKPSTISEKLPKIISTSSDLNTGSNKSLSSMMSLTEKEPLNNDIKVDRSNKPAISDNRNNISFSKPDKPIEKQFINSKQNEISELQQNIKKMQQDKAETEKRLMEMEEQKRLHLLSIQKQIEHENEELRERELKAKHDLAATMRQLKPIAKVQTTDKRDSEVVDDKGDISMAKDEKLMVKNKTKENSIVSSTTTSSKPKKLEIYENPKPTTDKDAVSNLSKVSPKVTSSEDVTSQIKPLPEVKPTDLSISKVSKPTNKSDYSSPMPTDVKEPFSTTSVSGQNFSASSSNTKSKSSSATLSSAVYQAPLKDQSDSQSFGLKRSFSSPNIAKMVQQEVGSNVIPPKTSKAITPSIPRPNRDLKPNLQEESDPYLANLSLSLRGVYGGEGLAKCGLRNLGNSCYMNSILQCMFNTTHLAEYILSNNYRRDINRKNTMGYGGKVAESFAVLLKAIWTGQFRYLIPSDMKQIAGSINDNFGGYTQEDSHEFLLFLLDGLHEDMNKISNCKYESEPDNDGQSDVQAAKMAWEYHKKRNESIIVELFTGQYKATLTCSYCQKTSRKFDAFRFLTLSLPSVSSPLVDLIRDFSKQEKLTGDDRWKCPNCKVPRVAFRTIEIWKLPPILIIHLKRFVYSGRWRDKIHSNVNFPISGLNLANYTCGQQKRDKYDLYAVSVSLFLSNKIQIDF